MSGNSEEISTCGAVFMCAQVTVAQPLRAAETRGRDANEQWLRGGMQKA